LHLDAALRERLAEVDGRLCFVDLGAAQRDQVADQDPGHEARERQPPVGRDRVPVAMEVDVALGVELRQFALTFPHRGHGR
jgi:hypothetical protein